jgi:hypothetical protein
MRGGRGRRLLSAIAAASALLCVLAVSAAGARVGRVPRTRLPAWASEIVSPSSGSVILGRSVRVVVRVGANVGRIQVTVGSRNVTGAWARKGATRVATLRFGGRRGLPFGRDVLHVRSQNPSGRRWFAQSSFVVARKVGGLLWRSVAEPTCGAGTRVTAALALGRLRMTVAVNGRRPVRVSHGGRERSVKLDADNGLRPGQNRVLVRALDATSGRYSVRTLRVMMPSGAPVAGAGAARQTRLGRPVSVSAGNSVPAKGAGALRYRWSIVQAPRGECRRNRVGVIERTAHAYNYTYSF